MSESMRRDKAAQSDPTTMRERRKRKRDDDQKRNDDLRKKGKAKMQESPVRLFTETLSIHDTMYSLDRFVIKDSAKLMEALTQAEREEAISGFLTVVTTDPSGNEYELRFDQRWGNRHMLSYNWGQLVTANGWKEGDTIEGLGFRVGTEFRLKLDLVDPLPPVNQDATLLFEKVLQNSDISSVQGRLLIPKADAIKLMDMLTEEERKKVEINRNDFLEVVTVMDGDGGVEYALHLKKWFGPGSIVLTNEWTKLVKENGLKKEDSVQVWVYRQGDQFRVRIKKSDQIS